MPSATLGLLGLVVLLPSTVAANPTPPPHCPTVLPEATPPLGHHPELPQIIDGTRPSDGTAAFLAGFSIKSKSCDGKDVEGHCTAALIAPRWLLTAAHCVDGKDVDRKDLETVRIGGFSFEEGTEVDVEKVITPGESDYPVFGKDIALIHLKEDAQNATAVFINSNPDFPSPSAYARAVGYGTTNTDGSFGELFAVDLPVVSTAECRKSAFWWIKDDRICAGYVDRSGCSTCGGDSGGPLLQFTRSGEPVIVGVLSSSAKDSRGNCGLVGFPDLFTRVSSYVDWIRSEVGDLNTASSINEVRPSKDPSSSVPAPTPTPSTCPVKLQYQLPFELRSASARIVGGAESSMVTARYMVSFWDGRIFKCSGVLLSRTWVLTVWCDVTKDETIVKIGGRAPNSGFPVKIEEVYQSDVKLGREIVLIKLKDDAPDSDPEGFPLVNNDKDVPKPGAFARAVGYSPMEERSFFPCGDGVPFGMLRQVDAPVLPMDTCAEKRGFGSSQTEFMCTGYEDSSDSCVLCDGGFGGPLLQFNDNGRPVVIALTLLDKCGNRWKTGLFLRISKFVQWMKDKGADFECISSEEQGSRCAAPLHTPSPSVTPSPSSSGDTPIPNAAITPSIFPSMSFPSATITAVVTPSVSPGLRLPPRSVCPMVLSHQPPNQSNSDARIVGGGESSTIAASYMVALRDDVLRYQCTGVLLRKRWVLTAGYCLVAVGWTAYVGGGHSLSGTPVGISAVYRAPEDFNRARAVSITLVKLARRAPRKARFVSVNTNASVPESGAFVRVLGYGVNSKNSNEIAGKQLEQVDMPVLSNAACQNKYKSSRLPTDISENMLCAGYEAKDCEACFGDLGAPLLQFTRDGTPVVVGVLWSDGCKLSTLPAVYIRTSAFVKWMSLKVSLVVASNVEQNFGLSSETLKDAQVNGERAGRTKLIVVLTVCGIGFVAVIVAVLLGFGLFRTRSKMLSKSTVEFPSALS